MPRFSIGLDYGTSSARCLIVDLESGREAATSVYEYPSGEHGILLDEQQPELARQDPFDYLIAAETLLREATRDIDARDIVGIGVDTTASTPIPLNNNGLPLNSSELAAKAWLWKDHTSHAEAAEITERAGNERPQFLTKCGGAYSSEWFWAKILRCARTAPSVFEMSATWIECCDLIPAALTGTLQNPARGVCAAGHKGLFHADWGGYPDEEFLQRLHPGLARIRKSLPAQAFPCGVSCGGLSPAWAQKTGLAEGTPVSVGGIDAHLGAIGSGISPGTLVKILGTSSCDMAVCPLDRQVGEIPGISGVVPESILPGMYGIEAGQAAVGDLFNWFTDVIGAGDHKELTKEAASLKPGQSGLLALDWNNGNRSILQDPRLTGLLIGQTLRTKPHEIYRGLVEASAFGALMILNRLEQYGIEIQNIIVCGGIADKSPFVLQTYADVTGRPLRVSASAETCALGAAICGAVAGGAFPGFAEAQSHLTSLKPEVYAPNPSANATYLRLFDLYTALHDEFGSGSLAPVMKQLLSIRDST